MSPDAFHGASRPGIALRTGKAFAIYGARIALMLPLVNGFALASCEAGNTRLRDLAPPVRWEGENVRFASEAPASDWCPRTLPWLDEYTGRVEVLLGDNLDDPLNYLVFEEPVRDLGLCPDPGTGCALVEDGQRYVVTNVVPHQHEIWHAVGLGTNLLPLVFEEGTASYLGGLNTASSGGPPEAFRELLEEKWDGGLTTEDYAIAADFVGYLIDSYGADAYLRLRTRSSYRQSRDEFEVVFQDTLGATLESVIETYESERLPCAPGPVQNHFLECEQQVRAVFSESGSDVEFVADLSCDGAETLGPRPDANGTLRLWQDVVIELARPGDGLYVANFDEPPDGTGEESGVRVEIWSCERACVAPGQTRFELAPTVDPLGQNEFRASPGRYLMRITRTIDDSPLVRFRL